MTNGFSTGTGLQQMRIRLAEGVMKPLVVTGLCVVNVGTN